MAYMTMSELGRQRRPRNLSGLGVSWSGHERGDYDPATGIPGGMSQSDQVDFQNEQAAAGLAWNGSAWVPATTVIPPSALMPSAAPAPATIYVDPATGAMVGAPAPAPAPYYYPPTATPSYAPAYYPPAPTPTTPPTTEYLPPPQTIVPADQVAPAPTGIAAVPSWAWVAGAAVLGVAVFIVAKK